MQYIKVPFKFLITQILSFLFCFKLYAVPIDWHGSLGIDSTLIDNFRRIESTSVQTTGAGTQEVALANGSHANASFQSYLVTLSPTLIINDSASIKGELTTGYGKGRRLGDESTTDLDNDFTNSLYYYNSNNYANSLSVAQLYMEIYADTATYQIGRHAIGWGMGAIVNDGKNDWSRHMSIRDGVTMNIKLGNFKISPFVGKIGSSTSLTSATKLEEWGVSLLYSRLESDLTLGVYYSKKQNNAFNTTLTSDISNSGTKSALGKSDVKITDIYFKKSFNKFSFSAEIPIMSGELGYLYDSDVQAKYKAKAFLFSTNYRLSDSFNLLLDFGFVNGDNGDKSSYDALYLHPNFHIANLLFKYNMAAVSNTDKSIYDSYITNSKYVKLSGVFENERSTWTTSFIWAAANEVPTKGDTNAYNHQTNKNFTPQETQENDLGFEIDMDFIYHWNNEIDLGISGGYHFVGDYFAFTNDSTTKNTSKNSYIIQVQSLIRF